MKYLMSFLLLVLGCVAIHAAGPTLHRTGIDKWRVCTHLRGGNLTVTMANQGTVQLAFSKGMVRLGGLVMTRNNKILSGTLEKSGDKSWEYRFAEDPACSLLIALREDGKVECTFSANQGERLSFSLLSDLFAGKKLRIDDKVADLSAPQKAPLSENARSIVFCDGDAEKTFAVEFQGESRGKVEYGTGKYGFCVTAKNGTPIRFLIVPDAERK
ncbi:MAG: hypothetical protein PHS41_10965 [Victivallaceae bacterium]|nr:hypothetical protein [Victivallaceae bacterium]